MPLAASVSLAAGLPFAFVRKPGYRGHEIDEPPVRGADVAGRRVLLVDDAVSSGTAVERFTAALAGAGAEVVGVFVLVDMREVADTVTSVAAALPTESVSTYLQVLTLATANGLLDPAVHELSVDAIVNRWAERRPALGSPARGGLTQAPQRALRMRRTSISGAISSRRGGVVTAGNRSRICSGSSPTLRRSANPSRAACRSNAG